MTATLSSGATPRRRVDLPWLRFGWSEDDTWTVGIGMTLALVLAVTTIPAVLTARDAAPRPQAQPAGAPGVPPAPATVPPAAAAVEPPAGEPVSQPLLGPLVPLAPPAPADERSVEAPPPSAPDPLPPTAALPAPGAVRRFAALPGGHEPGAVAAGADGRVWAGTDAPSDAGAPAQLLTWDAAGALLATADVPEQPAERTRGLTGLAPLADGSLAAVDAATSRLLRYDATARSWRALAQVPDLPPCLVLLPGPCQPGLLDTPPLLRGVAVGADGSTYLADAGQGTVWRLPVGTPLEVWYSSADLVGEQALAGLALDGGGHLLAVVTRLAGVQGAAAGALLRIDRAQDGRAGARTVVAAFDAGDDPVDVAPGRSGSAYVALRGADAVVTIDASGVEQLRVVDDALQGPTSVHLVAGRLLVAAAAPTPAVLEIGVADTPLGLTRNARTDAGGASRG